MKDILELILRVAIFIGIALFMWSVSASLETIAQAMKRLADRSGSGPANGGPPDPSP